MAMKKILLILALALVCSFNANAQTNGEELEKATKKRVLTAEDAVAKEATKELKFTEEAAKEVEFVEEKAYAEEMVEEDVAVPAEEVVAREAEKAYAEKAICVDCKKQKVPEKKISVSSEPCVTYTAEQALDATIDGNNNTFAAVYSTNATRRCGGNKIDEAAPVLKMRTQEDDLRELKMETREAKAAPVLKMETRDAR